MQTNNCKEPKKEGMAISIEQLRLSYYKEEFRNLFNTFINAMVMKHRNEETEEKPLQDIVAFENIVNEFLTHVEDAFVQRFGQFQHEKKMKELNGSKKLNAGNPDINE